jgi:hypothetical protein
MRRQEGDSASRTQRTPWASGSKQRKSSLELDVSNQPGNQLDIARCLDIAGCLGKFISVNASRVIADHNQGGTSSIRLPLMEILYSSIKDGLRRTWAGK